MSIITPMSNSDTCELEGCENSSFQMYHGIIVCLYHLNRGRPPQTFGTYETDETFSGIHGAKVETVPFDTCICSNPAKPAANCWAPIHN